MTNIAITSSATRVRDIMRREVVTVTESEDLALARQIMLWREVRHLPVVREGRVVGVLTERDVLARQYPDASTTAIVGTVGNAMQHPAATIHPEAFLADAAAQMCLQKIGCLPVVDAGTLVGIVTSTDVLGAGAVLHVEVSASVDEPIGAFMTSKVFATRVEQPLTDAVATMIQHGIRHLPVVDGLNHVVGILSERDVRTAIGNPFDVLTKAARTSRIATMKVSHAMTPEPRTIRVDAPTTEALQAFAIERFGALPVVDDEGCLVGIVSYLDLLPRAPSVDHRATAAATP